MADTPSSPTNSPPAAEWTQSKERSNRLMLQIMSFIALRGGRRLARVVLLGITAYFFLFGGAARRYSREYLDRALGRRATWRDGWRHVHHFASTVLDRVYFLRERYDLFDIDASGTKSLRDVVALGRGAIVVGGHVGSFEALAATGREYASLKVAMAMYPDNAKLINEALEAIAPDFKMRIIALGQRNAMLAARDWLDEGGVVGLLGDRALTVAGPQGDTTDAVWIPFLGQPAPFGLGPFRLAQILRRQVVFMVGLYNGGNRYEMRFEPLADFSQPAASPTERDAALLAAVHAFAARLESICRESPYNWFNFHDFWHAQGIDQGAAGQPVADDGRQRVGDGAGRIDGPPGPAQGG